MAIQNAPSEDTDQTVKVHFLMLKHIFYGYGKCPKSLHTKVADKMAYANNADPGQTAPLGHVKVTAVCTVCPSTKYSKTQLHKKQNFGQNCME